MLDIIVRAGCFVAIIILGYGLKRFGFFKQEDFTILSKITIRITLPATIIVNFSGKKFDSSLLSLGLLALFCGVIYLVVGFLVEKKSGKDPQAFSMLNLTGYNIGTFVIPFAQSFLGPMGVIATSLFDTGNSVMCLGGAYSLASMVKDGCGFSIKRIFRSLVRSVPFMCYMLMLLLKAINLPLPVPIVSCAGIIGNANAFMAMLMIGVGFQLSGDRSQIGIIAKLLLIRYGIGAIFASIFYFVMPFSLEIRQALVILALSPIASAAPAFTGEMKADVGLSSAINSISIIISIVITVVLLSIML